MIRIAAFADEASAELEGQIRALKRNGLEWIELRGIDGNNIRKIGEEEAKVYAKRLEEAGVRVWSIGSPIGKMKMDGDWEEQLRRLRHICRLAKIFGTRRIRMFSFYEAYEQEALVMARLQEMVNIAREYDCQLYHENEKKIFGDTLERVEKIMAQVEGLRYIYDPANYIEVGENPDVTLPALHGRSDYFHIKDALLETGEIVPAGLGDGKIPDLVARLDPDKDVTLTLEPHLAIFEGYALIDKTELKNKYCFQNSDEAFDAAVAALKKIILEAGWQECEGGFARI